MPKTEPTSAEEIIEAGERLREQAEALISSVTSEGFARMLEELQRARLESRRAPEEIITLASPENLRNAGVEVPSTMRVSTRYFENPHDLTQGMFSMGDFRPLGEMPDGLTICASIGTPGIPVCVSVGGEL